MEKSAKDIIKSWSDDAKEAADLVLDKYGEPDEKTESLLIWYNNGPWAKTVVSSEPDEHLFPMPHKDSVEQSIFYKVDLEKLKDLTWFDGSVTYKRTEGLLSARCHDEEANFLALNLTYDVITGQKSAEEAKQTYLQNMIDYRAGKDVPYMKELQFKALSKDESRDKDTELISKEEMEEKAKKEKEAA